MSVFCKEHIISTAKKVSISGIDINSVFTDFARFPTRLDKIAFWQTAYPAMYASRLMDTRIKELFRRSLVKGTVILTGGNEASSIGMAMPFRPGFDPVALLHRNLPAHLTLGCSPREALCQYLANEESPTHGKEGNVHFGNTKELRFPMLSHLGGMLAIGVGATWSARRKGKDAFGLAVIGDGGASTGQFHESLNIAAVHKVPVVFIVENNGYAFSTPTKYQYACENLSDRAAGYGITGRTVNGLDAWEVYSAVTDALVSMTENPKPAIIETLTVRLEGHAVYDNAEYVPQNVKEANAKKDPLVFARADFIKNCGVSEDETAQLEKKLADELEEIVRETLKIKTPAFAQVSMDVFAPAELPQVKPFAAQNVRNTNAVNTALEHILSENADAFLCGQDVGAYGSPFKTCKGLIDKFGEARVMDMPICEAGTVGFCLGASQTGSRPIMEFQFADFSTEAVSQLGLNAGTWFFRADKPAPVLFRLPCGAGVTLGAFHSGEFEGLWSRFPGLKLFYPVTPQETYEAILAGFYDPNPCVIFEHKLLYWGKPGDINFDGDLKKVYRPRRYCEGNDVTVIALGAMVEQTLNAVKEKNYSADVWNPYILSYSADKTVLAPIFESVRKTGRFLVVQEAGETAGLGNNYIAEVVRECFANLKCAPALVSAPDTPVPFAKELEAAYLPNAEVISRAIVNLL